MTNEEAKELLDNLIGMVSDNQESDYDTALKMGIKALEQEPRKGEVILTKKEYRELISNEYDNGYTKGYFEALEQESVIDKIRAELHATAEMHEDGDYYLRDEWIDEYFDKYKVESEDKE